MKQLKELSQIFDGRILVVCAHPDDETIGMGATLAHLKNTRLFHITEGSPKSLRDANRNGFADQISYARARKKELFSALNLARFPLAFWKCLGFCDQEVILSLSSLTEALTEMILQMKPRFVLTHPYEGGHPDHDAASFGVHHACEFVRELGHDAPRIFEFTSYHLGQNGSELEVGEFLESESSPTTFSFDLAPEDRNLRLAMLNSFSTQQETLRPFYGIQNEKFREAPHYDFRQPPHPGQLFYEKLGFPLSGARWRSLAAQAQSEIERKIAS